MTFDPNTYDPNDWDAPCTTCGHRITAHRGPDLVFTCSECPCAVTADGVLATDVARNN